jgi:hypothetical protein
MDAAVLKTFATDYATAWCSQQPANVARFFSENGSLTINGGPPLIGRTAIAVAAREFMTTFPDMMVTLDAVTGDGNQAVFRWTLMGTNTGPGGTGNRVRISGYEDWTFGADGLIAQSLGHYDDREYQRQLHEDFRLP